MTYKIVGFINGFHIQIIFRTFHQSSSYYHHIPIRLLVVSILFFQSLQWNAFRCKKAKSIRVIRFQTIRSQMILGPRSRVDVLPKCVVWNCFVASKKVRATMLHSSREGREKKKRLRMGCGSKTTSMRCKPKRWGIYNYVYQGFSYDESLFFFSRGCWLMWYRFFGCKFGSILSCNSWNQKWVMSLATKTRVV